MKKSIIFIVFFCLLSQKAISAETTKKTTSLQQNQVEREKGNLEYQIRGDFNLFLGELYTERERGKKEAEIIMKDMVEILEDTKLLIDESRKEIRTMSYSESRNLLIASIFLWISITIFIIMNLIFANNLKKELYFLRNGLLRSEIKDSMINLSNQLTDLNQKLELTNKGQI